MRKTGIVLLAHGARDARWAEPFQAVAAQLQGSQPNAVVKLAFLEFMAPSLLEAGMSLAQAECLCVEVVPLFLGGGGHVRKDVPLLLERLAEQYPLVAWRLHPAVGESAVVVAAMVQAATQALDRTADPSTANQP